jgi:threonine/homoserine/homoserine lactone efflux protein
MPSFQAVLSVLLAGIALSATPGPSMLYVLSHSVGQGRLAGLASALGLCLGGIILAIATAFGLAAVFASFGWLVTLLSYLGSAYLVWLGVNMILSARSQSQSALTASAVKNKTIRSIVWQGLVVEVMNPKTVLFFALFLPPFVSLSATEGGTWDATAQLLLLGSLVPLTALPSDVVVALLGGTFAKAIGRKQVAREVMGWFGGLVLIAIAISLHVPFL